ncbi:Mobile element protein [Gilliamella apicola]|nr:Mobile element protein [Gilliamella apicola]
MIAKRNYGKDIDKSSMDRSLYRYRHLVENAFARIKQYRSISTRYDKLERNYASMVSLAFMLMWLPMYC